MSRSSKRALPERLDAHLRKTGLLPEGVSVAVALSGGLDSVVLLRLLMELRPRWGWRLGAAHFDHRMRPNSDADARWVAALCERFEIPCRMGEADPPPSTETEARERRYEFLHGARRDLGADRLATAHQADDQVETVLFRLLRGTGVRGLAGIPARREPGIVRPLLPFWRAELEAFARERELDHREDPTNRDLSIVRNRLRENLIPLIESRYAPRFREQLHRLARQARRTIRALDRFVGEAAERLILEASDDRLVVARPDFLAYDTEERAHLLRYLVDRVGPRPGRVGTRTALEFIRAGSSGRQIDLPGDVVLRREFDHLIIERPAEPPPDRPVEILGPGEGEATARIGGVEWRVEWGGDPGTGGKGEFRARFDSAALRFPLRIRSWEPGDRIRLPGGRRKLKKLFVDRRVGRGGRSRYPVVADEEGVLWIVGLVRGVRAIEEEGSGMTVGLRREG